MDDYETDEWLMSIFEDRFDPCPKGGLERSPDDLEGVWDGDTPFGIFINPPYSNPLPWVKKAIRTKEAFGTSIVMLLKHDSSTEWYRSLHEAGANFLLVNGRLKHRTGLSAAFPSLLVIL
tara:strand:- start:251 stop:610 length:360 start_codon:yes stop_codon:yes gene_type:complete